MAYSEHALVALSLLSSKVKTIPLNPLPPVWMSLHPLHHTILSTFLKSYSSILYIPAYTTLQCLYARMSLPTTTHDLRRLPETQQPQLTTDHYHHYSDSITITFTQLFALLGALLTLKLYHGISTLSHGKRPAHQSIEELERRIVALFQAVVPEGLYRINSMGSNSGSGSGAASRYSFHCDSDGNKCGKGSGKKNGNGSAARSMASASTHRAQPGNRMIDLDKATTEEGSAHSPLMRVTTNIAPAIRMSQGLSRTSGDQLFRTVTAGTTITESVPEMSLDNSHGGNRQSFASCQAHCGSMSSAAPPPPASIYAAYRPGTPSSTLTCPPPQNTPETGMPITTNLDRFILQVRPPRSTFIGRFPTEEDGRSPIVSQSKLTNESEEEPPTEKLDKWPGVEQEQSRSSSHEEPPKKELVKRRFIKGNVSPTDKDDENSPIYDAGRAETELDSVGGENEDEDGDGEGGLKLMLVRSAESYPGKFPVSEGLPLEALATAPICVRGKAQTSVRPLSEL